MSTVVLATRLVTHRVSLRRPEDKLSALPPKANIFNSSDGSRRVEPEGHADGLAAIERRQTLSDTDVEPREGETTFQRLLEDAGGAVACLDLPEHPNSMSARRRANADA